ncbi:MAG: hypothetical protein EOO38_21850 [Cytophagaceae bacterium]|nr:MAG: hypothetical protein EOO38_21850 [Cytophagaceae bacterium]
MFDHFTSRNTGLTVSEFSPISETRQSGAMSYRFRAKAVSCPTPVQPVAVDRIYTYPERSAHYLFCGQVLTSADK